MEAPTLNIDELDATNVELTTTVDDGSTDSASSGTEEASEDTTLEGSAGAVRPRRSWGPARLTFVAGVVLVVLMSGLAAWQGWHLYQLHRQQMTDDALLRAARQGAINLTTINYNQVDSDIARVLDSLTGSFRDDFKQRSQPFAEVVKQAKSISVGSVTEAALESSSATQGQALVAISVKTSDASGAEQKPRLWRMRVSVDQTDHGMKISNVEFVP